MYDYIGDYYAEFITKELEKPNSHFSLTVNTMLGILGNVEMLQVCDLACGEGHLSRMLAKNGAIVTGFDLSSKLLSYASAKSPDNPKITYIQDDVQSLKTGADDFFDIVVCNLALMDIPNINMVYQTVNRILKDNGQFVFSILHPCFETPFAAPDFIAEKDGTGQFVACRVTRYTEEGYWTSGGAGMRGRVGAYHRKLSTYVNGLRECGFQLLGLEEPTLYQSQDNSFEEQWLSKIPRVLIMHAQNN